MLNYLRKLPTQGPQIKPKSAVTSNKLYPKEDKRMSENQMIRSMTHPKEYLEEKAAKERGDVVQSLNGIEATLAGILDKEQKIAESTLPALKKKYRSQVKASRKYLNDLFETLKVEMEQSAIADRKLVRYVKPNKTDAI